MRPAERLLWKSLKYSRKMSKPCFSNINLLISSSAPSFFFFSGKLFHKIALTSCKGCLSVWWIKYFLLWAPQGQLPKQKHSPNVVLGRNCFENFPNFHGIKLLMKTFPSKVPTCDFLRKIPSQIFPYDFSKVL